MLVGDVDGVRDLRKETPPKKHKETTSSQINSRKKEEKNQSDLT